MKDPTFVSVIVRVGRKPNVVSQTLQALDDALSKKFRAYELVVINDTCSEPVRQAIEYGKTHLHGSVVVLEMAYRQGVEIAMLAGLDRAMGDFVFEVNDTRIDYPIDILIEMYAVARSGYDVVAAVPRNQPLRVRLLYRFYNEVGVISPPLRCERLRVSSRRAIDAVLEQPEHVRYRQILYRYTGYRHSVVSYDTADKGALRQAERFSIGVCWSLADAGFGISRKLGAFFAVFAVMALTAMIVHTGLHPWTTLMAAVVLFAFTGLFIHLSIICGYLAMILTEVRGRPLYTLDQTLTRTTLRSSLDEDFDVDRTYGERTRALEQMRHATGETVWQRDRLGVSRGVRIYGGSASEVSSRSQAAVEPTASAPQTPPPMPTKG